MARTRLFSSLTRALRAAVRIDAPRPGFSRRALLQGAGLSLGAMAAARTLAACNVAQDDARIVVVGAGLAGLTAAYRLTQQGFSPQVFDASTRVGGRCLTDRTSAFNNRVDLGGEFVDSDHAAIRDLAAELSLPMLDLGTTYGGLAEEVYRIGDVTYSMADMVPRFEAIAPRLRDDFARQGSVHVDAFDNNPTAVAMDHMSLREWFDQAGSMLDPALRALIDVAYTSEYGLDTDQQSYLNLLYLVSPDPTDFSLFGTRDARFVLTDGAEALTTSLAGSLARPPTLGARLTAVRTGEDALPIAVFSMDGVDGIEVAADHLVLALPFNQLRRCDLDGLTLSSGQRTAIRHVRYGTTTKVALATSSRVWVGQRTTGTSYDDTVYDQTWDAARGWPGNAGVLVAQAGGTRGVALAQGRDEDVARAVVTRADATFPGVAAAYTGTTARAGWPTTPFIEGSYACYGPGDRTTFGGYEKQQAGNVHFAGEHTSEAWQGSMNGAVESGERAAQEVLDELGG